MTLAFACPPAALHDGSLSLRIASTPIELSELAVDWERLELAAGDGTTPAAVFFQSYAWSRHVAAVRTRAHPNTYRAFVAVGSRGGEIVAIWPLSLQWSAGLWGLRNLDEPFGQFAGLVASDDDAAVALVQATLDFVTSRRLAATARFERLLVESAPHRALLGRGATPQGTTGAPRLDLRDFASFDEFKRSRNKKTMKNLRNTANRMAALGDVVAVTVREPVALDALIRRTLANREQWLAATGNRAPPFRLPEHAEVLLGGLDDATTHRRIGFELSLAGQPIAQQWGFVHDNRYYAYMSGMALDRIDLSPGRLHLAHVIEAAFAEGFAGLEFLSPASDYKLVWSRDVRDLVDLALPLSGLGRLRHRIWDAGLRPAVKTAYYALPPKFRRRLGASSVGAGESSV